MRVSYANEEEYEGDYEEGGPEMGEYDGEGEYGDFGDLGDMGMGMDGMGGYGEDEISPGDHIPGFIELDDMTFEKFVPGPRPALVEFYADWCGHCKTLAKELDMIGTVFGEHRRLDLVKVNADVNSQLAQKFGIEGFPTLKFFHTDGTIEEVEGREMDELADFLWDKVGKVSFVPQLKPHLERFMQKSNDRSQVLRETEEAVAELTDSKVRGFGELYLKIMRGIIKKGDDYLEKVIERSLHCYPRSSTGLNI